MASKKPEREESFEDAYRRLEETVAKLEAGGLQLEEAIALYEEGMKLAQRCQEVLDKAELRISRLQEAFGAYTGGLGSAREESAVYRTGEEELPLQ